MVARAEHDRVSERRAAMVASQMRPDDGEVASGLGLIATLAAITGRGPRIAF
jgi:hypothetical protein